MLYFRSSYIGFPYRGKGDMDLIIRVLGKNLILGAIVEK